MKRVNRAAVLSLIRLSDGIARSEIAVRTGLTKATVTNLVGELIEEGLVREAGPLRSTGGRKPIPVVLSPRSRFVLGVDVGIGEIRVAAVDLSAEVLVTRRYPLTPPHTNEGFLETLTDGVRDTLHAALALERLTLAQLLGIGIGMHGVVDRQGGTARFAPNLHLSNIHIRDHLTKHFPGEVAVDNDVRAMAAGERWFCGAGDALSDFIYVNVGVGVGAAVVVHGELLRGVSGGAGEIGHNVVEPNGARCACGKRGCLETVCSGPSLARRALELMESGRASKILDFAGGDPRRVTGETVFAAAEAGDGVARELFQTAGMHLGLLLGHLTNAIDPSTVIIGGGVSQAGAHLMDPLVEKATEVMLESGRSPVTFRRASVAHATQLGAAAMVLESTFSRGFVEDV